AFPSAWDVSWSPAGPKVVGPNRSEPTNTCQRSAGWSKSVSREHLFCVRSQQFYGKFGRFSYTGCGVCLNSHVSSLGIPRSAPILHPSARVKPGQPGLRELRSLTQGELPCPPHPEPVFVHCISPASNICKRNGVGFWRSASC